MYIEEAWWFVNFQTSEKEKKYVLLLYEPFIQPYCLNKTKKLKINFALISNLVLHICTQGEYINLSVHIYSV